MEKKPKERWIKSFIDTLEIEKSTKCDGLIWLVFLIAYQPSWVNAKAILVEEPK